MNPTLVTLATQNISDIVQLSIEHKAEEKALARNKPNLCKYVNYLSSE